MKNNSNETGYYYGYEVEILDYFELNGVNMCWFKPVEHWPKWFYPDKKKAPIKFLKNVTNRTTQRDPRIA